QRFEKYDLSLVFFKRATRANPPFAEVAEVRFFCFLFLVKRRKALKVLCILVLSMQGFVGRGNSRAEHTLYGYKKSGVILDNEVMTRKEHICITFVLRKEEQIT